MLNWYIEKNVIAGLYLKEKNIINPWGIETADSWSFFSMEKNVGYRYEVKEECFKQEENLYTSFQHIKMKEGEWTLETSDEFINNYVIRTAELTCLEDSYFMDFVVRFRFKKNFLSSAFIAGQEIKHTASNIYHQHLVNQVSLEGEELKVSLQILDYECLGKFQPHLYVRDHNDEWVVHARMMPSCEDKNIIKLCSQYFKTSPLPDGITKILLKSKGLKDYLWYHSEHSPYISKIAKVFSPNAFPLVKLSKGQKLRWKVGVVIDG